MATTWQGVIQISLYAPNNSDYNQWIHILGVEIELKLDWRRGWKKVKYFHILHLIGRGITQCWHGVKRCINTILTHFLTKNYMLELMTHLHAYLLIWIF